MPRQGPRRPIVAIRLGDEERARAEARAERDGVNLSERIRRDIERGNRDRNMAEIVNAMWERVEDAPESDKVNVLKSELAELDAARATILDKLDKRGVHLPGA